MTTLDAVPPALPSTRTRFTIKSAFLSMLLWGTISALGALQTYSDNLRAGAESQYSALLKTWFIEYAVPLMVLATVLSALLSYRPALVARPGQVVALFAGLVLVFQPTQWIYMAWLRGYLDPAVFQDIWSVFHRMLLVGWFSSTGTFAAILAMHFWRQAIARELAWQRSQTDLLNLRLALEEQRMLALRGQLEPHFLFNALNAISALVRRGDTAVALNGIGKLSDLLRYALSAGLGTTTTLAEELQFVRDYLDLQRLRYGDRLQVHVQGDLEGLHQLPCVPLLLQPLIENALRHDLDCHDGPSEIRLNFKPDGDAMVIEVSNAASAHVSQNPGAGLGLANTRERLRLMNPAATLRAERDGNRFVVEVRLPLTEPD
jgi:two-component system sensor histidine kinase AlgZ